MVYGLRIYLFIKMPRLETRVLLVVENTEAVSLVIVG